MTTEGPRKRWLFHAHDGFAGPALPDDLEAENQRGEGVSPGFRVRIPYGGA